MRRGLEIIRLGSTGAALLSLALRGRLKGGGELKLASQLVNPACLNEPQWSSLPFPWAHSRSQMQSHTSVNVQQHSWIQEKGALAWTQLLALMMCSRAGHQFAIVCLGSCPVPYQPHKNEAKPLGLRGRYHSDGSNEARTALGIDPPTLQKNKAF